MAIEGRIKNQNRNKVMMFHPMEKAISGKKSNSRRKMAIIALSRSIKVVFNMTTLLDLEV